MQSASHSPTAAGYDHAFVADILADATTHRSRVFAIAGLQGTGKSTLSAQVRALAAQQGRTVAVVSIDDFYLGHDARQALGRQIHPLCATRGPPGTHDVTLACDVIDALRGGEPIALPRFDKIADDRLPDAQWPMVRGSDLVILEGWFLAVPAEPEPALRTPLNVLERDEDPDGVWRHWSNACLASDYAPLWSRLDRLLFLQGPGFAVVPQWRWQQEQALQLEHPGRTVMTQPQVERFVQFFQRVSEQALRTLPGIADRTIRLDAQRRPLADNAPVVRC